MTGVSDCPRDIVEPKFHSAIELLRKIQGYIAQFGSFDALRKDCPKYHPQLDEVKEFAESLLTYIDTLQVTEYGGTPELDVEASAKLNREYKSIQNNPLVQKLYLTCSALKAHTKYLSNKDELSDAFIRQDTSLNLQLFKFSSLNFTLLWGEQLPQLLRKYILMILHKLLTDIMKLHKLMTSPNVDISKFSGVIMSSIREMKKRIPRCNQAFKRIEEAVDVLNGNFDNYYRSSVRAGNMNMIMESFISDVVAQNASTSGNSTELMAQFSRIVAFMKKTSSRMNTDPRAKALFAILRRTMNQVNPGDADADADAPDDAPDDDANDDTADVDDADDNDAACHVESEEEEDEVIEVDDVTPEECSLFEISSMIKEITRRK